MNNFSSAREVKDARPELRVHIEYEVKTDGAIKLVELPFVMGVLADLSGKSKVEKKPIDDRDFLEFDMDNFEERMEAIAPRVSFPVANTITGEDKLPVDLTFSAMKDFSPGEIAKNVPALRNLLDARQQLNDLMIYMDGKTDAQDMLGQLLKDPDLMKALAAARPQPASAEPAAQPDGEA